MSVLLCSLPEQKISCNHVSTRTRYKKITLLLPLAFFNPSVIGSPETTRPALHSKLHVSYFFWGDMNSGNRSLFKTVKKRTCMQTYIHCLKTTIPIESHTNSDHVAAHCHRKPTRFPFPNNLSSKPVTILVIEEPTRTPPAPPSKTSLPVGCFCIVFSIKHSISSLFRYLCLNRMQPMLDMHIGIA